MQIFSTIKFKSKRNLTEAIQPIHMPIQMLVNDHCENPINNIFNPFQNFTKNELKLPLDLHQVVIDLDYVHRIENLSNTLLDNAYNALE